MKKRPVCFLLCLGILGFSFVWPTADFKQKVLQRIKAFHSAFPIEKVYLHTDKPYYALGEKIWFKAYVVDGMDHQFVVPSKNLYVDLVNPVGEVAAAVTLRNPLAGVAGDFALGEEMETGTYILRAYTRNMQNFPDHFIFQKEVRVFDKQLSVEDDTESEDLELSGVPAFETHFFPEGGDLIQGLTTKVGFKAIGKDGNGIVVEGKVFDEQGQFVTVFKTLKFGLGFFSLTPEAGKIYTAHITYNGLTKEFVLPTAKPEGYTMKYIPGTGQKIQIVLESNEPGGLEGTLLYGHARGSSLVAESVETSVSTTTYEIPIASLPEGVVHLTLFSPQGLPVCERLIFISKPASRIQMLAKTDQPSYGNRSKVNLELQLASEAKDFELGEADLSISITDRSLVNDHPYAVDIQSYLLLTSELKGRIEQPAYYFDPSNSEAEMILDLLMMTQGWRRFQWDQVLAEEFPPVSFLPEESLTISGQVTKIGEADEPLQAKVFFNTLDDQFLTGEAITGEDGKFAFTGLSFADTTAVVLKANRYRVSKRGKKNKKGTIRGSLGSRNVAIQLDQPPIPQISSEWAIPFYEQPVETISEYLETQQNVATIDSNYRQWSIDLDAVTIKARKLEKEEKDRAIAQLYKRPDERLVLDSLGPAAYSYPTVFDLIHSRFAGVQIQGEYPNQQAIIRGNSSLTGSNAALFVVDGVIISNEGANSIPVQDIAYVDILKSNATAAIYGGRAANGVIAIYTKKGDEKTRPSNSGPRMGIIDFEHPGYYKARTFYQPNYDQKLPEHTRPDIRTTLYWNPNIRTDKTGSVHLEFYTDDKKSTYQVDIQGITRDGIPFSEKIHFTVQ